MKEIGRYLLRPETASSPSAGGRKARRRVAEYATG